MRQLEGQRMSDYGVNLDLEVPLYLEHDLETDDDGTLYLNTFLYIGENDESTEVRIEFQPIVETVVDIARDFNDGYKQLYGIAHEFERHASRMRDLAEKMEESIVNVGDLFEVGDLDDVE
jgi:hypothetical protein